MQIWKVNLSSSINYVTKTITIVTLSQFKNIILNIQVTLYAIIIEVEDANEF